MATQQRRIAVVGCGAAGLSAAYLLGRSEHVQLVLYEERAQLGGHANTVEVEGVPVDTGFLVYNESTYSNLIGMFEELGVHTEPSDMSFSVSLAGRSFEWSSAGLSGLFADGSNALNPSFYSMVRDMLRFNGEAPAFLEQCRAAPAGDAVHALSMGEFLRSRGYGEPFKNWYLIPQMAAVWSSSSADALAFPARTFIQFCANHSLLQVLDRPQWRTVSRRSREYVRRLVSRLPAARTQIRLSTRVTRVTRRAGGDGGVEVADAAGGVEVFDDVLFGAHPDEVLSMLGAGADAEEAAVLSRFPYQTSTAYLHTDAALMPARRSCWTAWNYVGKGGAAGSAAGSDAEPCCVTYWLNLLQNLPPTLPQLFVTLNPAAAPAAGSVLQTFRYAHPQYTADSVAAQAALQARLQGRRHTWFAGAYLGYGFHEDAITAGLRAAHAMCGVAPTWWARPLHTPARMFAAAASATAAAAGAGAAATPPSRQELLLQLRASGGPYWEDNLGNGGPVGLATLHVRGAIEAAAAAAVAAASSAASSEPPPLGVSEEGDMTGRVVEYPGDVLLVHRVLLGEERPAARAASLKLPPLREPRASLPRAPAPLKLPRAGDDGAFDAAPSTESTSPNSECGSGDGSGDVLSSSSTNSLPLSVARQLRGALSGVALRADASAAAPLLRSRRVFKSDAVRVVAAAAAPPPPSRLAAAGTPASAAVAGGSSGGYSSRVSTLYAADAFPSSLSYLWHAARSAALTAAASPVLAFLARSVRAGCLLLRTPDGVERMYGDANAGGRLRARMRVHSWNFFLRVAAEADLGLSRAFIAGEWTTDDLTAVFHVFTANREGATLQPYGMWTSWVGSALNYLSFATNMDNSIAGSRKNIHAHYDLSNDLFTAFLDPVTLMYSCGFFRARARPLADEDGAAHPPPPALAAASTAAAAAAPPATDVVFEGSLAEAQLRKLDHLIARANVQRGDRVLDLGFGWGGLAIRLAETVGCRVHGITLSREQFELASERVRRRGLGHLITFEIVDYRDFAAANAGAFQRIISVEMVEAVGFNYFPTFMAALDRMLAPDGVLVLQAITLPEPRYAAYVRSADFINTTIFPGGCCPSITALLQACATSHARLVLQSTDDFGLHYGETLRRWRANFNVAADAVVRPLGFDDAFIRTWNYYLCYCEAGFSSQTLGLHVLTFARPGTAGLWSGARHGALAAPLEWLADGGGGGGEPPAPAKHAAAAGEGAVRR